MPEDKPYLQKVYNSLNTAYGSQGSIAKNVFTMSFDDFSKRISSNPGYAEKIYSAVDAAYGPNGTLKAGSFNSSLDAFKGKVLTPKISTAQPPQIAEPAAVQQPSSSTIPTGAQPTPPDDPNAKLLASGKDLQLPEQKQPGVIADQSAIEPLISAKQQKDDADLQRGKELLTQPKSELNGINMSGTSAIPTDQEISIQDKLHQMDEQDKRLHSVQAEADAFAKTTAGGLYYSFVRPVYQSLVGTGGNLLAGTARMAGDLGESMGLDKSKKVLDKVADGLTDYFDFNRLAREGNTSSYLNVTPTSQEGKLSKANILPKAMEAITSMGTLIGGSKVMGGDAGGLFISNYMATYEDYHKQAKSAGLNNLQADQFAITSAGVNSALLMISPETFLGKSKALPIGESSVFKAIQNGVPIKDAVRNGVKGVMKQLGEANAIVLSTDIANHVLRTGADLITGERHFNEHSLAPSMNDALETGILTSIAMGTLNGGRIAKESAPSNMERSAWAQAAEKPELFQNGLQKAVEKGTIHPDRVPQLQQEFTDYKGIYDALKAQVLPKNPNADIPRMALDALKSKMQTEQAKPLSGIPGLKAVNEQVGEEQAKTERDIRDGLIGIPEKGETVTADELKVLMAQSGGEKKTSKLTNNDYKVDEINLGDLYKNDPKFKSYIDNEKLEPNSDKNGLHMPVVIDADGGIVDGMNRLAQQYKDGNKTARAFIETKTAPVEEAAPTVNEGPTREQQANDIRNTIDNSNLNTRDKVKAGKRLNSLLNDPNRSMDQIKERLNKDFGISIEEQAPIEAQNPETQITEPKTENNAIQEQSTRALSILPEANNSERVREGNAEHQVITEQSQQPEAQGEVAQEAPIEPKTVKPKGAEEAKARRDAAAQKVREEWSNFQNKERPYQKKGVDLPDPVQDKKLYAAMLNYAKEEILYRANQVKGFAKMKKAQIKSSIRRAMNAEGIKIGISDFTELFDNAYAQIKKIPGVLGENIDRVSFKEYIKAKIQTREKGRREGFSAGKSEGILTAKERVTKVNDAINATLKKWGVDLTADQQKKVTSLLNDAATAKDIEKAITRAVDLTTIFAAKNKTQSGDKGFDSVSFKDYIKGKMQSRERGRKEGIKEGLEEAKVRVKAVKAAINETIKESGVKLSMLQMRRVISLLQQSIHGGDISKSIDRAIDATTQMVWEAKHKLQIADTKKLIKSVNGLKKSKSMVLQDVEWLKQLQLPSPSRVDDLATYQEMLKDYVTSRKGDNTNPKYTREEIAEFVQDENDRIYKEKQTSMQGDLDALKEKGVVPDDVSLDDYIAMLDNSAPNKLSEGINKKAEILRGELKTRMGYLKERLPEFDGVEKDVVERLANVDISSLDGPELMRLNNVLNNIAEYGSLDAAGDIITSHEARVMNKELAESGDKLRALPKDQTLSKKNLSNYISALFYNDGAISRFRGKVLGGIENKTSHVKQRAQKVVKEFVELNKKHKIDGLSNAKLHAFSYLNQYRGIESGEIADNLKQRLGELIDDATYLFDKGSKYRKKSERSPLITDATNRLEALKQMGLLDYEIDNGKLKVDVKDVIDTDNAYDASNILHSLLTEGEQAVYKFVRDHYDALTDKLSFVTRTYAGKEFQDERNYVSLVSRPKTGAEDRIKDLSESTDITGHLQSINAKPANTTISRSNKKSANIYYDGDFFSNFVNRYYTSLYTAEVLPELQRTAKMVNSEDFKKFITGQFDIGLDRNTDQNYVKFKEKLADAINEEKYAPFFKKGKEAIADKIISKGVKMVLGNIWQGPKQYVPALLHNITINNTKAVGYALASRGKALIDPEFSKERHDFLENFTGVQRSTMGSAAYDQYVKTVNDASSWVTTSMDWLNKAQKASSFILEKADHMAQNDAYIASYLTSLIREGKIKSVSEFDMADAAKNPDKTALAYAEQMASNINNESAKAYRPETLKDSEKAKYLWLLQGFSLNAYQNAMNKLKIISDNRSTATERKEAAAHFMGYLAEVGSYQLVGKTARGLQMTIAAALLSSVFGLKHEESEEEKKNRKGKENIKVGANILGDLMLSGLNAPMQGALKITANYAWSQWAKSQVLNKKAAAKQRGEKFDPRGTYLSPYYKPYYGVDGPAGAADFYTALAQKGVDELVSAANSFETKETVEDTESKKLSKKLNLYLGIPATVLGSGDLMLLNTRMQAILKEASKKEKKASGGSGSARGGSRGRTQSSRSSR